MCRVYFFFYIIRPKKRTARLWCSPKLAQRLLKVILSQSVSRMGLVIHHLEKALANEQSRKRRRAEIHQLHQVSQFQELIKHNSNWITSRARRLVEEYRISKLISFTETLQKLYESIGSPRLSENPYSRRAT